MSEQSFSSANSCRRSRKESSAAQQKPTKKKSLSSTLSTALSLSRKAFGSVKKISSAMQKIQDEEFYSPAGAEALELLDQYGSAVKQMGHLVSILKDWERKSLAEKSARSRRNQDLESEDYQIKYDMYLELLARRQVRYLTPAEACQALGLDEDKFKVDPQFLKIFRRIMNGPEVDQENQVKERPWEEEG